jgi:hypothetical protein
MNAQAMATVSTVVVALVQLIKWTGKVPDGWAPLAVLACSVLGVACWGWQYGRGIGPFEYLAGTVMVMTSAAGVFGFVRATNDALTSFRK